MKTKMKVFFSLLLILGVIATSCKKDDPSEPVVTPPGDVTSGLTPNITIEGILDLYNNDSLTVVEGTIKTFNTDLILEAKVISTDKYGNLYKQMYIKDATGSLLLSIDGSNLFNDYNLGQTVHLKLKGLNIDYDDWTSVAEIGLGLYDDNGTNKLGRIPVTVLPDYLLKNGAPSEVTPTTITLDNTTNLSEHVGDFIKIENAQIISSDTNATYADAVGQTSQNLNIETCSGTSTIILRTSGYANFAGTSAPKGNGDIKAILTKYGSDYQLILNTDADVSFTGTRCGGSGGGTGTGTGSGTKDDPYDVEAAIANNNSATGVWVTGYLVGVMETGGTDFVADLTAPFATNTNAFLAPTANETDTAKMIIIKLPSGDIRTATNLVDNGTLLGSEIMYHGDLMDYFSAPGMQNTNGYWLNGAGIDPDYVDPNAIWNVNFTAGLSPFTGISITGTQTWNSDATYGAVMSGYEAGSNYANEDWLVSSAIDLTGKTGVKFNINQAVNYLDTWDNIKIYATDNYTGDVSTTTWSEIVVTTKPAGDSWDFIQSEDVDFSAFDNKSSVVIAFKYISSASAGSTWEIKNVTLKQ